MKICLDLSKPHTQRCAGRLPRSCSGRFPVLCRGRNLERHVPSCARGMLWKGDGKCIYPCLSVYPSRPLIDLKDLESGRGLLKVAHVCFCSANISWFILIASDSLWVTICDDKNWGMVLSRSCTSTALGICSTVHTLPCFAMPKLWAIFWSWASMLMRCGSHLSVVAFQSTLSMTHGIILWYPSFCGERPWEMRVFVFWCGQ